MSSRPRLGASPTIAPRGLRPRHARCAPRAPRRWADARSGTARQRPSTNFTWRFWPIFGRSTPTLQPRSGYLTPE
eukprot:5135787-Lingulodinium_polyedra.AAC.1